MRHRACELLPVRSVSRVAAPRKLQPAVLRRFSICHQLQTLSRHSHPASLTPSKSLYSTQRFARPIRASSSSYIVVAAVAFGSAIVLDYFVRAKSSGAHDSRDDHLTHRTLVTPPGDTYDPFYTEMPVPSGHHGNLSAEQEARLREFWAVTLKIFGVEDPHHLNVADLSLADEDTQSVTEADGKDKKKSKKRLGLFKKKDKDSSNGTATPTKDPSHHADSDDKYGQYKEFQDIIATQNPETIRATFWSMVKADHPDALLLRFLRARKWDVEKALVMLVSTMRWRSQEQHVDDDIMLRGEGGALEDSKSSDPAVKKEGTDFLTQLRLGKSFLHGTDKEGRPLCFVRVRLHKGGEQTERSLERYTVYVIETARLALRPPVETAVITPDPYIPRTDKLTSPLSV